MKVNSVNFTDSSFAEMSELEAVKGATMEAISMTEKVGSKTFSGVLRLGPRLGPGGPNDKEVLEKVCEILAKSESPPESPPSFSTT